MSSEALAAEVHTLFASHWEDCCALCILSVWCDLCKHHQLEICPKREVGSDCCEINLPLLTVLTVLMLRKIRCRVQSGHDPTSSLENHLGDAIMDYTDWLWGLCLVSDSVSAWKETHSFSEHQILNSSLLIFCLDTDASTDTLSVSVCLEVNVLSGFHASVLSRKEFYIVEQSGQSH